MKYEAQAYEAYRFKYTAEAPRPIVGDYLSAVALKVMDTQTQ
jgi:hypothetical protein